MKEKLVLYYFILFIMILPVKEIRSQAFQALAAMEKVQLCPDRNMYISGEKILFSAMIFRENGSPDDDLSRILYVEIITPDGTRINGGKYMAENSAAHGCLKIPEETITGIYFLKSYTRFMRNGSTSGFNYIMLKIINPDRDEVLTAHGNGDTSTMVGRGANSQSPPLPARISTDKKRYSPHDSVHLKINGITGGSILQELCLSVIPEQAFMADPGPGKTPGNPADTLQFYPETRGISITGRLLDSKVGRSIPGALVSLSIIGDKDIMGIRTDSAGRYFFALPAYFGSKDIFLCAANIPGSSPEIFIDNDFCPKPVSLPSPLFHLTEKEKEAAYQMAVNKKITSAFLPDTATKNTRQTKNGVPFYGDPTQVLVMEKYIDLPTVEEYFNELPVEVKVRKIQGRKYFRFFSDRTEMTIYDPLVLVDWVAVDDIDRVLALQPKALDRIELVNAPYIKGNITYGGIISFVSKDNDFAGIDLPSSGTFINYKFLEYCSSEIPVEPMNSTIPDSRNTVYWDPDVKISDKGPTDITFTTPDTPGRYLILLRGISVSGVQTIAREELEVVGY